IDALAAEIEGAGASKEPKGKKKKKGAKKDDFEYKLLSLLFLLSLFGSQSRLKAKGGKKGGRKVSASDEDEDKDEDRGVRGGGPKEDESEDDEEFPSRRDKKKKNKAKAASEDEDEQQDEESGGFKMKTAAQKKAEKKERERKKKEEERMKQRKLKEKESSQDAKKEPEKTAEATPPPTVLPTAATEEPEGAEPAERLEQERKEKKKQKEKERKERLKKEGKLLTKTQREARARAEATLKMLQAQGVEVPSKDSVPKKKPVYGDKRRKKPSPQTPEGKCRRFCRLFVSQISVILRLFVPFFSRDEESEEDEEKEKEKVVTTTGHGKRRAASEDESSESDDDDGRTKEERLYDRAKRRIEKRRAENLKNIDLERLRAPVVCVLGHVDTGKTKILDKLRHTHVQDGEAGGITQQIGATNVPKETIEEQTKMVKNFDKDNLKIPGMLIIDTPGHESFSNLRNRGSSLCDIAILVVDIMHGLEPQTLESINLLKEKKCPFIVALNKIDRLYDWKKSPETDVVATLKKQKKNTKDEFDERAKAVIVEFAQQGLNAALFYENKDPRTFVSLVPTSAHSGDGMGNLIALLVELTQTMLARRLAHCDELRAQVMEVKALPGMGTTIDVILINGRLREGETIIVPGVEGPIVTQIRGLLLPPPLKELRVKSQYEKHKEVSTSQGVKILGKDLEKTLAGLPLLVAHREDEVPVLRDELERELKQTLSSIKLEEKGVYVQASTLGSLEALLEFLRTSKVPYAGINIGPVHKKDVMKASTMLEHDLQYAVILAFDVKVERESQEMADSLGVRIFSAEIIYHLFDAFTKYREDYKKAKQDEFKHIAVFPAKLRVLPQFIFNSRDPIVMGVTVEAGVIKQGTPLCVPSKGFVDIGVVTSIEVNHKSVESAKKGQEICVKIEPIPGESPKMYGRHFEATDIIVSKITRASIDALKNWFRDEMQKSDWQLIMELKKTFEII
uniref:Eukaryotic translation initiation factor 5B n=1 Tax=Amphiprion ocellaris TaxID=80972 RepID=A0AAQ5ZR56_AMPOC